MAQLMPSEFSRPLSQELGPEFVAWFGQNTKVSPFACLINPNVPTTAVVECFTRLPKSIGDEMLIKKMFKPWLGPAAPNKIIQYVRGIDGKQYLVLKLGKQMYGCSLLSLGLTGAALGALGTLSAVILVGGISMTKGGQTFWKKLRK